MTTTSNGSNLLVQGRIVWTIGSSLFEGKAKTDYNTNAPVFDLQGNPIIEYGFGLAIPKVDPTTGQNTAEYLKVWETLHKEAYSIYPSGQLPPDFAMKFKDGDSVDHNGKSFADREGYKGHIVINCTTQIPIKYFVFENGNNILVNSGIRAGDYVNVQLNVKAHPPKGRGKAGLYLNPSAVQLIQKGKEIINTPSGDQVFGQTMPSYNGQVIANTNPAMPGQAPAAPVIPQQGYSAPTAPAMPQQGYSAPTAPAHFGVLPQTHQPTAPVMPQQGYGAPTAPVMPQQGYGAPTAPVMPPMPGQQY